MNGQEQLSKTELESYRSQGTGKSAGKYLRYFCPIHGSDNQRSLQVNPDNGHFRCFSCGAWGYLDEFKEKWSEEQRKDGQRKFSFRAKKVADSRRSISNKKVEEISQKPELTGTVKVYQDFLPGSWGEEYLSRRGISPETAGKYSIGYSPFGNWLHRGRDWKFGRLVFSHTNSDGGIVNLYGRAVGSDKKVPREIRHDHLPGAKGVFNAKALMSDTVFICEGVFDALSLISAGYENACAIFGINGMRWEWIKSRRIVFCLDNDSAGSESRSNLCWEGSVRGKDVYFLSEETYRGYKDLNELWVAEREIDVGGWE